jgi:hypothetical protein
MRVGYLKVYVRLCRNAASFIGSVSLYRCCDS